MSFKVSESRIVEDWIGVKNIIIGEVSSTDKIPNKLFMVYNDGEAYLLVKVYYEYETPFLSQTLWSRFLFFGMPDHVCYIDLATFEAHKFDFDRFDSYFGYFYQYSNLLLIASSNKLYCFDEECRLVWKTDEIGIDGVVVHGLFDTYLLVSGENDPPGGWVDYKIGVDNGKLLK